MNNPDQLLETLVAEREISRLIHRFNQLNDAGEHEALVALFTEDGLFARPSDPEHPLIGHASILAGFKARPPRITRHVVGNIQVNLAGTDEATASSHVVLYTSSAADAPVSVLIGGFEDRLVRRDGRWLFQVRQGSLVMKGSLAS